MKIFKKSVVLALCFCLVFSLVGCLKLKKEQGEEEQKNEILQKVDVTADTNFSGKLNITVQKTDSEKAIINSFVEEFKAIYKNIEVTVSDYLPSAYMSSLRTTHSAALQKEDYTKMPDVFWMTNETMANFVILDMVMPLTILDQADDKFTFNGLVQKMVRDATYNNSVYMMPRDYNQIVMYYNKEMFDIAGVSYPSHEAHLNQNEFLAMLRDLSKGLKASKELNHNGVPYSNTNAISTVWDWGSLAWPILKSFGGQIVSESGEIDFDSLQNQAALEFIKELMIEGLAPTAAPSNCYTAFAAELAPICFESRAIMTQIMQGEGAFHGVQQSLGVAPMPMLGEDFTKYSVGAGCSGYSMYRNATNATAAWLFLKFMVGKEAQNAFSTTGNGIPVNESLLLNDDDAVWKNLTSYFPELPSDFNHDAFIYSYETAATTMEDFKQYLPVKSVEDVASYMTDAIKDALYKSSNLTYKTDIASNLTKYAAKMKTSVDKNRT